MFELNVLQIFSPAVFIVLMFLPSGSLASSIFDPLSALVGASGGVYALLGGYFMNAVVVSLHTQLNWRFCTRSKGLFELLELTVWESTNKSPQRLMLYEK